MSDNSIDKILKEIIIIKNEINKIQNTTNNNNNTNTSSTTTYNNLNTDLISYLNQLIENIQLNGVYLFKNDDDCINLYITQLYELILNVLTDSNDYIESNEKLFVKIIELLHILCKDGEICMFLTSKYAIVNHLCGFILCAETRFDENYINMAFKIILNLTRTTQLFLIDSSIHNMLINCINKILNQDYNKQYFEFLSNVIRNNPENVTSILNKLSTIQLFQREIFKILNQRPDVEVVLHSLILATKLVSSFFISIESVEGKSKCGQTARDAIEYALTTIAKQNLENNNCKLVATYFLIEFFKSTELLQTIERYDKLINGVLLRLNIFLIKPNKTINEEMKLNILKIINELCVNDKLRKIQASIIFDCESVIKTNKKFKYIFDDENITHYDLFNDYLNLIRFDKSQSQSYFINLCQLFSYVLKSISRNEFNGLYKNKLNSLISVLMFNFIQIDNNIDVEDLCNVEEKIDFKLKFNCNAHLSNLHLIDFIIKNVDLNFMYSDSLREEFDIKEKILDFIQKILLFYKNQITKVNISLDKKLLLLASHTLLCLIDTNKSSLNEEDSKKKRENYDYDEYNDRHNELNQMVYLYLRDENFVKTILITILKCNELDYVKLAYDVLLILNTNKQFSFDNFFKLYSKLKGLDELNIQQSNLDYASINDRFKSLKIDYNADTMKIVQASVEIPSDMEKLINFYTQKLNESAQNENELKNLLTVNSNRTMKLQNENNFLIKQLNEALVQNLKYKKNYEAIKSEFDAKVKGYEQQINDFESINTKLKVDLKKVQDMLDNRNQEFEQIEKDYEETIEKFRKEIENDAHLKKDLHAKMNDLKVKHQQDIEKFRQNYESRLREQEEKLNQKEKCLDDKIKEIQEKNELNDKLQGELEKVKGENEKIKSLFSYVKNFNL